MHVVAYTGGRVHAKAGTQQSLACHSHMVVAGHYFVAAANLEVQTHGDLGCKTSKRSTLCE